MEGREGEGRGEREVKDMTYAAFVKFQSEIEVFTR